MKKWILAGSLLTLGFGASQALAGHGHHNHHTEYVCHETGRHHHGNHYFHGSHAYDHPRYRGNSGHVTYTYQSRPHYYSESHYYYERPKYKYKRKHHYERGTTVRVREGVRGNLNIRF